MTNATSTVAIGAGPILPKRRLPNVPAAQLSLADEVRTFEVNRLPLEVEVSRYLAAVDTFTAEGHPPTWRAEVHCG
jgi:hypothetical protein